MVFKNALSAIGPSIVEICNASLLTGVVPRFWKHAVVEPMLKESSLDPTQLKNYRPISKLPLLSKILEKVVADQLTAFLEKHEIYDTFLVWFP